jgi:hypothetical protein
MMMLGVLVLLQNGLVVADLSFLFFFVLLVIALIAGLYYLKRLNWPRRP